MSETPAAYGEPTPESAVCPVCRKALEPTESFCLPVNNYSCFTEHCALWCASMPLSAWRWLHRGGLDLDSDAVQECRKAIARLGRGR